jgi:hypothetical protein
VAHVQDDAEMTVFGQRLDFGQDVWGRGYVEFAA